MPPRLRQKTSLRNRARSRMPKLIQKLVRNRRAKPAPQDDLKTLPLAEVEKKLESSPDGLTDAEAQEAAHAIWAE